MAGSRPDTWMPMYWGDYLKDTGHLSTLEHGAYLLLIGHYWSSGAPLPDDDAKLRRIAKIESAAKWKKLRPVIETFFRVGAGVWRHGRVDRELEAASKRSSDAKARAGKAAKARWQGQHDDIPEDPHGDDSGADEEEPGPMLQACSKHSIGDALSIGGKPAASESAFKIMKSCDDFLNTEISAPNAQVVEFPRNPDACSTPQAMLEQCPSQPQSSSYESRPVTSDSEAASSSASPRADDGPQAAMAERAMVDQAFALWLPVAHELGIPDPLFLNPERRAQLSERLRECGGIEGWKLALVRLREAEWLLDDGKPKRWLNLYTLTKPENFTGLMEGRYAERHADSRSADNRGPNLDALAAFGREGTG
ncbi:MAG: YdaU family protein [Reyranella sp.]